MSAYIGRNNAKITNRPAWDSGGLPINCAMHRLELCRVIKRRTYQTPCQKGQIWPINVLSGGVGRHIKLFSSSADSFGFTQCHLAALQRRFPPKYGVKISLVPKTGCSTCDGPRHAC